MKFDVVFHHGGEFVKDWVLFYRGGCETIIQKQDFDDWSFVKANGYLLKMEYNENTYRMWRKMDDVDSGYKAMVLDQHVVDLGLNAMNKMEAAHIWVEHNVKDILENVACPAFMELGPSSGEDSDGSQQSVNVVRFEDSEEERADCVDDGFGITELPLTVPNTTESKKKLPVKRKGDMGESSAVGEEFAVDYHSEDLDSTDPENSEAEGGIRYPKFRKEQMGKDYEFKLMMEFTSLEEFKEAIRDWNVMNNKEIKLVKNDSQRVRVVCRNKKCGYLVLCSKVSGQHTYQIKTFKGTHTCPNVINNKSATSKWISKSVANKLQSSKDVKVTEIIHDMRRTHSLGVSFGRAWKAREIAKEVVEGDATKQYL
jgi:hypothetical protein